MIENNNNEELLKVENLERNEYLVSSSIIDVPKEKVEKREEKVSVLRLIIMALTPNKSNIERPAYYSLRPVKTVKYAVFIFFFTLFMYLCGKLVDDKIYVPLLLFFIALALPLLFITFHYELNFRRNITIFQMLFAFVFGIVLYIVIEGISDTLLLESIYKDTIDIFIVPILWGLGETIFLAFLSRLYNLTDIATNILLAVCVGMGYAFMSALFATYSGLFHSVEIIIPGQENYIGQAIIDYSPYMEESFGVILDLLFWDAICFPFLLCCWSIVMGTVVSMTRVLGKRKNESSFSVYLLLVLVIILHILTVFPTTIGYFEMFLKILCAVISLFVAIRLENNAIYDTLNDIGGLPKNE